MNVFTQYFDYCQKNGIKGVINPRMIQFQNRGYHLFNQIVSVAQGKAIRKYLDWTKTFEHCQLREVVIDTCQM